MSEYAIRRRRHLAAIRAARTARRNRILGVLCIGFFVACHFLLAWYFWPLLFRR